MRTGLSLIAALRWALAALLLSCALGASARGDEASRVAALDRLFAELRVASNAESANAISLQIWAYWTHPEDPVLADRMETARTIGNFGQALPLLDAIVADYPDYAEGWNQRATLYFLIGKYEESLADCAKVLALEPRHFGALSGQALIYLRLGKRELALDSMRRALTFHPFLTERRLFPELEQAITRT